MKVLKPGLLTTVQDIGRTGYQKYGVLASGAMDTVSLRIANLLIGNGENEAGLEITMMGPGPSFHFSKQTLIAVTGADFTLRINDEEAPLWKPVLIKENSTVSFGPANSAAVLIWRQLAALRCLPSWKVKAHTSEEALADFMAERFKKKMN